MDLEKFYGGNSREGTSQLRYSPPLTSPEVFGFLFVVVVFFFLFFLVGILYLWHIYYIAYNITTIEESENSSIASLQSRDIIPKSITYPYDLGIYNNFKQVFGPYWVLWIFPFPSHGDGFNFPVTHTTTWPPRQYYLYKKYPHGKPSKSERNGKNIVRRGSEGYLVKSISAADREAMVNGTYEPVDDVAGEEYVSSTDYDSLDEDEDHVDIDSDSELLGDRKKRLN